ALGPSENDIHRLTTTLPFHTAGVGIGLESAEHPQLLLGAPIGDESLHQKEIAAGSRLGIEGQIGSAKWPADLLEQEIVATPNSATFQIGSPPSANGYHR